MPTAMTYFPLPRLQFANHLPEVRTEWRYSFTKRVNDAFHDLALFERNSERLWMDFFKTINLSGSYLTVSTSDFIHGLSFCSGSFSSSASERAISSWERSSRPAKNYSENLNQNLIEKENILPRRHFILLYAALGYLHKLRLGSQKSVGPFPRSRQMGLILSNFQILLASHAFWRLESARECREWRECCSVDLIWQRVRFPSSHALSVSPIQLTTSGMSDYYTLFIAWQITDSKLSILDLAVFDLGKWFRG